MARLCGYLPLALRIAAAHLTNHPAGRIAAYVTELTTGDRLDVLQVPDDEQAAVRSAFDLSYRALGPDAQHLFRRLGLVPGRDFTAEVAATVSGPGGDAVTARRSLDRLAAAHLVQQGDVGRYSFHDLLRLYAENLAAADDAPAGRVDARHRILDFYRLAADHAGRLLYPQAVRLPQPAPAHPVDRPAFPDQASALAWLDAERANLCAAVLDAAEHGPRSMAYLLADALRPFLWMRDGGAEWVQVATAARSAAEAEKDVSGQAAAHLSLAQAHRTGLRYADAARHATRAHELAEQDGWEQGLAAALADLGIVDWEQGQLHAAAEHLGRALTLSRASEWLQGEAGCLANLAVVNAALGHTDLAVEQHREGLAFARQIGFRAGEALTLTNLSNALRSQGQLAEATDRATEAVAAAAAAGHQTGEARALTSLALTAADAGRYDEALEFALRSLADTRGLGDRKGEVDALNAQATTEHRRGQHAAAITLHRAALRRATARGYRNGELDALIGLARAGLELDDPAPSVGDVPASHAERAMLLARESGFGIQEGLAATALAQAQLAAGETAAAARTAEQAVDTLHRANHRLGTADALRVLGIALDRQGDSAAAVDHWQRAHAILDALDAGPAWHHHALRHARTAT